MVRITNAVYHEAYEYIKQDSVEGNCIVFVSADVDSLCAVLMFQALLKSDIIPHKIVPVSGYEDLREANEKLVMKDENLRSIVLFNCCGGEYIQEMFTLTPDTKVYIIDSHRPFLMENLSSQNNLVCVFDDESNSDKMKPLIEAYEKLMSGDREEHSDYESEDEEDEDGRPINRRPRQRRRLNEGLSISEANERRRLNRMVTDYYRAGTSFSGSVSAIIYQLAQQLGKTNNELLWLAIVGVTSLYIFEKMDTYKYGELLEIFKDDRARFNIDIDEDGAVNPRNVIIKPEDEYRFMLFRHWSLYDSMYHSGYVASKLGVWKDAGKKRLNNMFAKMGFSLQQCNQLYTHMNLELKQMLRNKIEVVAPLYGLTDICFPSFVRNYGWECSLSASDVVYSISTILETSPTAAAKLGVSLNWNETTGEWQTEADSTQIPENGLPFGDRKKWWMRNFYTAYDALNHSSPDGILRGIQLCMKTQQAIVRQGTDIIDKKLMRIFNTFRYIRLDNGPDLSILYHPSSLTKLALFLTDAYREHAKKNMPVVVGSYDEHDDSYLVVALSGAPQFGETRRNTLGTTFQEAAISAKVQVSFDSFDTFVIQVKRKDVEHYMEVVRNSKT